MSDVFPFACDSTKGHRLIDVEDPSRGMVAIVCDRCGQAVPLSVAIARTPTPTIGAATFVWREDSGGSGTTTTGSKGS